MVKIRLMRLGAKKRPFYRVVVSDSRSPRDGRFIENLGKYHPLEEPSLIEIDGDRALHWLRTGAQPTEAAVKLLKISGVWETFTGEPTPAQKAAAPKKSKKVQAKEAAAAAAPAEPAAEPAAETPAPEAPAAAAPAEEPAAETPAGEPAAEGMSE